MNDFLAIFGSIIIAFLLGLIPIWFLLLRGFLPVWLKARRGGFLVVVHLRDGIRVVFRHGVSETASTVRVSLFGSKDVRYYSVPEGSVKRGCRVHWLHVDELDTCPFLFQKVLAVEEDFEVEEKVPVLDDKGEQQRDAETKALLFEDKVSKGKRVAYKLFEAWDDTHLFRNLLKWALMRPRRKLPGTGIDMKQILIGVVIVAAGIFFLVVMPNMR